MAGNGVAYAVSQTQIGLAIEATRGTAVAPKFWLPVKGPKYKPDLTLIPDDTLQGSMVSVYNLTRGMRYDGHGWDSYPYLDSFPALVRMELGSSDTVTAAGTATTLTAAAAAGASTVTVAAAPAAQTFIVIGSGSTQETHKITGVASLVLTITPPLTYAQSSGATVTPLTSHLFSLLNNQGQGNQPPSATITDYDGEEWRQLTASQLDELTIKGNATGYVDYTCTWFANPSTTPTAPVPSFSSVPAVPGWTTSAAIGGTILDYVVDWEFDFKRGVKPIPALTGTEEYFLYFANTLECTGKITVVEQSGAPEISQYLAGTQESFDFTVYDLASGFAMEIHSSKAQFKTGEIDRSKEYVDAPLEFQLLPTSTDATAGGVSPVAITIANATTTAY